MNSLIDFVKIKAYLQQNRDPKSNDCAELKIENPPKKIVRLVWPNRKSAHQEKGSS
jgi:hypothetical protein